jgi:hypothetical protein
LKRRQKIVKFGEKKIAAAIVVRKISAEAISMTSKTLICALATCQRMNNWPRASGMRPFAIAKTD